MLENGTPVVAPQFGRDAATIYCTVDNRTTRLNVAHVMILPSRIDGAGLGLFLRPALSGAAPTVPMHTPSAIMLAEMSVTSRTW